MADKKGFVVYESFIEAGKLLKPLERLELYETIFEYGFDETYKPDGKKKIVQCIMQVVRPQIDASRKRYKAKAENGKKGGAPKGNSNALKRPEDETDEEREARYRQYAEEWERLERENNLKQPKTT